VNTPTTPTANTLTLHLDSIEAAAVLAVRRCLSGEVPIANTMSIVRGLLDGATRRPTSDRPAEGPQREHRR
jgi:hypothetical protein